MSEKSSTEITDKRYSKKENGKIESKQEKRLKIEDGCHQIKESLLNTNSGFNNYQGLINLAFILLVLSNARLALNNILKYGLLIDPIQWVTFLWQNPFYRATFHLILIINFFVLISLFIERNGLANKFIDERTGQNIIILNLTVFLLLPPTVIWLFNCNPIFSSVVCSIYSIVFLKLISYHSVNHWHRTKTKYGRKAEYEDKDNNNNKSLSYPRNLTTGNIYYFLFAPTLCYEINFPRSKRFRFKFLIKRLLECIILYQLILCLVQQWMIPAIRNSMEPFDNMEFYKMIERLLNLAVPNHIIWLLCFYAYFHSLLNLMAELLTFGDRQFYQDWWNAESVADFWQKWNVPVHKWCVRHLYKPLVYRGYRRSTAALAVFAVSAFFHEYIVSIPLNMFRLWAFASMLAQIPLIVVVQTCLSGRFANAVVWLSLIIGQPLAILMYYHDYYIRQVLVDK